MPRGVGRDILSGLIEGAGASYKERKTRRQEQEDMAAKSSSDLKNMILGELIKARLKPSFEEELSQLEQIERTKAMVKDEFDDEEETNIFNDPQKMATVISFIQGKPIPGLTGAEPAEPQAAPVPGSASPGAVPGVSDAMGVKGMTVDPIKGDVKLSYGETPSAQANREVVTQTEKDQRKQLLDTTRNTRRAMTLIGGLSDKFANKLEAQGGGGVVKGIKGMGKEALKMEGASDISEYKGQKNESALAFNNILTNQNRAIMGVIAMIHETFPDSLDTAEFGLGKLSQSVDNAFGLQMAVMKGQFDEDLFYGVPTDRVIDLSDPKKIDPKIIKDIEAGKYDEQANKVIEFIQSIPLTEQEIMARDQLKFNQLKSLIKARTKALDGDIQKALIDANIDINNLEPEQIAELENISGKMQVGDYTIIRVED